MVSPFTLILDGAHTLAFKNRRLRVPSSHDVRRNGTAFALIDAIGPAGARTLRSSSSAVMVSFPSTNPLLPIHHPG
jgi:hypothetical protein